MFTECGNIPLNHKTYINFKNEYNQTLNPLSLGQAFCNFFGIDDWILETSTNQKQTETIIEEYYLDEIRGY